MKPLIKAMALNRCVTRYLSLAGLLFLFLGCHGNNAEQKGSGEKPSSKMFFVLKYHDQIPDEKRIAYNVIENVKVKEIQVPRVFSQFGISFSVFYASLIVETDLGKKEKIFVLHEMGNTYPKIGSFCDIWYCERNIGGKLENNKFGQEIKNAKVAKIIICAP